MWASSTHALGVWQTLVAKCRDHDVVLKRDTSLAIVVEDGAPDSRIGFRGWAEKVPKRGRYQAPGQDCNSRSMISGPLPVTFPEEVPWAAKAATAAHNLSRRPSWCQLQSGVSYSESGVISSPRAIHRGFTA